MEVLELPTLIMYNIMYMLKALGICGLHLNIIISTFQHQIEKISFISFILESSKMLLVFLIQKKKLQQGLYQF